MALTILIGFTLLTIVICAPANMSSSTLDGKGTIQMPGSDTKRLLLKVGDPNCKDMLDNCIQYEENACSGKYKSWAEVYCRATCGICTPIQTTSKPCIDEISDCSEYQRDMCTDKRYEAWVMEHCRYFCKKCGDGFTYTSTATTTLSRENCYDKIDDCIAYGSTFCTDEKYDKWARAHCMYHCGFCKGTPPPCEDKLDNCKAYVSESCTSSAYRTWAKINCRATCKLCAGKDCSHCYQNHIRYNLCIKGEYSYKYMYLMVKMRK